MRDRRDMPTQRADFCAAEEDKGPKDVNEPIETLANPHSCSREERNQGQGREIEEDVI